MLQKNTKKASFQKKCIAVSIIVLQIPIVKVKVLSKPLVYFSFIGIFFLRAGHGACMNGMRDSILILNNLFQSHNYV